MSDTATVAVSIAEDEGLQIVDQEPDPVAPVKSTLADGAVISFRRLGLSDIDDVVRLYEKLTDEERYLRFFTMHPAHLHARAKSLAEESDNQYALGAFEAQALLGVANYVKCDSSGTAEVAVVVAHDQHLRGVGTELLRELGKTARRKGIHRLVAEVLIENQPMIEVLSDAGWPCTHRREGPELHIEIDLDAAR